MSKAEFGASVGVASGFKPIPPNRTTCADKSGDDTNIGDMFKPKATIQSAHDALPGDATYKNIFVGAGNFTGNVNVSKHKVMLKTEYGGRNRSHTTIGGEITVSGDDCTVSGFTLTGASGKITVTGKDATLNNIGGGGVANIITVSGDVSKGFVRINGCDLGGKTILLSDVTGFPANPTPRACYITNGCENANIVVGMGWVVIKSLSSGARFTSIDPLSTVIDLDSQTPYGYDLLKQLSKIGSATPVPVGALIIDNDAGGDGKVYRCTTGYTVAASVGVGTPIDKSKYSSPLRVKTYPNQTSNLVIQTADVNSFDIFEINQTQKIGGANLLVTLASPSVSTHARQVIIRSGATASQPIDIFDTGNTILPNGVNRQKILSFSNGGWFDSAAGEKYVTQLTQAQILALPPTTTGKFYATDTGRFFTVYGGAWRRYIPNTPDIGQRISLLESKEFFDAYPPVNVLIARSDVLYNASTYPALFNKYGSSFGGNGSTTFALPELRGSFIRGADLGSGNDPDHASRNGGMGVEKIGSSQSNQNKEHRHYSGSFNNDTMFMSDVGASGPSQTNWGSIDTSYAASNIILTGLEGGSESRPKNNSELACVVVLMIF